MSRVAADEQFPRFFSFLPQAGSSVDPRSAFRTKTVGTRLSVAELEEVEAAARRSCQSLAEWLRDNALREARQRPGDPVELLLAELAATRYMLLNLFHATALAHAEGRHLLPDSVLKIRETADARKLAQARKTIANALTGSPTRLTKILAEIRQLKNT